MVLWVDGPVCGCGGHGCFEALASRTALDRDLRAGLAEGRESSLREAAETGRITSGLLAEALAAKDALTTECMTRLGHYLGQGVLSLRHVVDPDLIILGGGVIEACGDFLMPLVEAEVRGDHLRRSHDSLRVVQSQLGDDAVALGAAALAHAETGAPRSVPTAAPPAADPPPPPAYPRINSVSFGAAVVDKREMDSDLYIRADGKLKQRKKKLAREKYGTSHVLGPEELQKVLKGNPPLLIIAAGFSSMVHLTEEAEAYLRERGVQWQLLPTPQAVPAFNEAHVRKALFMHVTC
jgi:glucokinase